ncbi:MAG: Mg-chelatase subunit ChlD [Pedosphaera sp.]|nr:Mg-chelatase subunit ChlD [Pedosphaera sp.]
MSLFAAPKMLWLLLILVPPLIAFFWWAWRKRQQLITQFISPRLLGHLKIGVSPSRQKFRMALIVVSVVFLILTMARPQWGFTLEEAKQRGLDIIIAIDTSNSMLAEDVPPNRLARAKLSALDLMRRAKSDRLGLIAFAGSAFLQCPLTLDDAAFSQSVDSLDTRTISDGGTALAEAIDTAAAAFKDEADNHKVLILFTDGEDHDSEAVAAAERAAKEGMRIFTVGIGTPDGEVLRIHDERGRTDYIRDEQGQPVKSKLNEKLLQQIATDANGFYLPLRGTKTMDTLYERGLAPLPKSENSSKMLRRLHERYHWPLAIAMLLLIFEMFLPDRKRKRKSENAPSPFTAQTGITETVTLLFLLALPMAGWSSPAKALREYEAGKYDEALKEFRQSIEKKKDDQRLHFNAGTAAYQSKQFEEAAKQFNETLNSPDLQLQQRAYYNLGNTMFRMGQTSQDPSKKQEAWESSLKHFESALKLNQQDPDAKFNQQFVEKQLEELKKQQQQQQQQNQDKSKQDKNSKQDQKNDQSKEQQKNQEKDSQSQKQDQDKSQQSKDSQSQKGEKEKSDQAEQDKKQADAKKDKQDKKNEKDQQQQQASDQAKDQSKEEAEKEAAMMAAGQMTPKQAQQLLDAQKGDEEVLRLASPEKRPGQPRQTKNW